MRCSLYEFVVNMKITVAEVKVDFKFLEDTLYVIGKGRKAQKWVKIKKRPDNRSGLFACKQFQKDDVITVFHGFDANVNSGNIVLTDGDSRLENRVAKQEDFLLGAHFINLTSKGPADSENSLCANVELMSNFEIKASKLIQVNDEMLLQTEKIKKYQRTENNCRGLWR